MTDAPNRPEISPAVIEMMRGAKSLLEHEHSLFKALNLRALMIGAGQSRFSVDTPPDFAGPDGKCHSGLLTIILDSMMGVTVFTMLEKIRPIATINLRTDVIAPPAPGVRVVCESRCETLSHDIAHVSARLTAEADGELVATAVGAFMVGTRGADRISRL